MVKGVERHNNVKQKAVQARSKVLMKKDLIIGIRKIYTEKRNKN